MFLSVYVVPPSDEARLEFPQNTQIIIAVGRTLAFLSEQPLEIGPLRLLQPELIPIE